MKGSTPSRADKQLWNKMAELGCIACRKEGHFNTLVSIHHIAGPIGGMLKIQVYTL